MTPEQKLLTTTVFPEGAIVDDVFLNTSLIYFDKVLVRQPSSRPPDPERIVEFARVIRRTTVGGHPIATNAAVDLAVARGNKLYETVTRLTSLRSSGIIELEPALSADTQKELMNLAIKIAMKALANPEMHDVIARAVADQAWADEGFNVERDGVPDVLGGHLKTGQSWTGQNRPVEAARRVVV